MTGASDKYEQYVVHGSLLADFSQKTAKFTQMDPLFVNLPNAAKFIVMRSARRLSAVLQALGAVLQAQGV